MSEQIKSGGHVRAFDGVRGLAILGVVGCHVSPAHVPFGSAGVTLFFVLSGYLITTLILRERDRNGRFDYLAFYGRRALRLYPALILAVTVGWIVLVIARDPQAGSSYPWEAITAVLYLSDVTQVFGAAMPVLGHTWSLAVEEQFYLVWPALLLGVLYVLVREDRRRLRWWVLGVAVLAVAARLAITFASTDAGRIYFAPDSNAFGLLLGAALAVWAVEVSAPTWAAWSTVAMFVGLCLIPLFQPGLEGLRLRMCAGTVAAVVSAAIVWSAASAGKLLENPVLCWIGRVSYGWYLWHQILWAVHPVGHVYGSASWHAITAVIALAPTALSYYFVERPLQRRLKAWVQPRTTRVRRAAGVPIATPVGAS